MRRRTSATVSAIIDVRSERGARHLAARLERLHDMATMSDVIIVLSQFSQHVWQVHLRYTHTCKNDSAWRSDLKRFIRRSMIHTDFGWTLGHHERIRVVEHERQMVAA